MSDLVGAILSHSWSGCERTLAGLKSKECKLIRLTAKIIQFLKQLYTCLPNQKTSHH